MITPRVRSLGCDMPISDPDQLVAAFKNSGEFDKLRRELLANAQNSDGYEAFKARLADIVKQRLQSGQLDSNDNLHKELIQEVNRFPVVDRFASETTTGMLASNSFNDNLRSALERILREDQQKESVALPPPSSQPSAPNDS
ncbi:hypothetical protein MIND_00726700 [Mycena indigotica]|uniref:BOD1/SHG1 domain-containing protein n=1 Tax=Mycena indigotica TaxID=2126181 RepID=A0A8H6SMM6_9AGAR|nr:uncharacterized protein MIND_00726700 [Mycena indigotica]KAF7301612.1 hypothetical protein MIND_00726700 [Mycena indigotica]